MVRSGSTCTLLYLFVLLLGQLHLEIVQMSISYREGLFLSAACHLASLSKLLFTAEFKFERSFAGGGCHRYLLLPLLLILLKASLVADELRHRLELDRDGRHAVRGTHVVRSQRLLRRS